MGHTKTTKKMLANLPAEERCRTLKIMKMEQRLEKKRSSGEIIGVLEAYDRLVADWYRELDRKNERE